MKKTAVFIALIALVCLGQSFGPKIIKGPLPSGSVTSMPFPTAGLLFWFFPRTNMYQDIYGSTPVTDNGQTVLSIRDSSGQHNNATNLSINYAGVGTVSAYYYSRGITNLILDIGAGTYSEGFRITNAFNLTGTMWYFMVGGSENWANSDQSFWGEGVALDAAGAWGTHYDNDPSVLFSMSPYATYGNPGFKNNTWVLYSFMHSPTNFTIRTNGVLLPYATSNQVSSLAITNISIGTITINSNQGPNSAWLKGHLGEVLIYNRDLSSNEIFSVETWIATNYPIVYWPNTNAWVWQKTNLMMVFNSESLVAKSGGNNSRKNFSVADGDGVSWWGDTSGNFNDVEQGDTAQRFTNYTAGPNGYPFINMGTNAITTNHWPDFVCYQPFTEFFVIRLAAIKTTRFLSNPSGHPVLSGMLFANNDTLQINAGTYLNTGAQTIPTNGSWLVVSATYNGASSQIKTNGNLYVSGNAGSNGRTNGIEFTGLMDGLAHYSLYNRSMTSNQIRAVEESLGAKYGISTP